MSDRRIELLSLGPIGLIFALLIVPSSVRAGPIVSCPEEMALVGDSCVDRWEASLIEIHKNGTETPWTPYYTPMGHVVRAVSKAGVVPQGHISMAIASGACKKAGKRLCKATEWVAACRGAQQGDWPYGAVRVPGVCIDSGRTYALGKLHPGAEMYENRTMNDPRLNQVANTVALTGSAVGCTNELGVHDMVGNLNEWIDDETMRGGFYFDVDDLGEGCSYATKVHSKVYNDYSTGFRCCMDATVEQETTECGALCGPSMVDLVLEATTTIEPMATFVTAYSLGKQQLAAIGPPSI